MAVFLLEALPESPFLCLLQLLGAATFQIIALFLSLPNQRQCVTSLWPTLLPPSSFKDVSDWIDSTWLIQVPLPSSSPCLKHICEASFCHETYTESLGIRTWVSFGDSPSAYHILHYLFSDLSYLEEPRCKILTFLKLCVKSF